jgi:hypothetical protein
MFTPQGAFKTQDLLGCILSHILLKYSKTMYSGAYRGVQLREQEEQQRHNHPHHQVVPPTRGRVSPTHPTTQQDQTRLRGELQGCTYTRDVSEVICRSVTKNRVVSEKNCRGVTKISYMSGVICRSATKTRVVSEVICRSATKTRFVSEKSRRGVTRNRVVSGVISRSVTIGSGSSQRRTAGV